MGSINTSHACVGGSAFGRAAFAYPFDVTISYADASSGGSPRSATGWGFFGKRSLVKPELFEPFVFETSGGGANLTLSTFTGSFLGRIRTDVQNSIVKSLSFTIDKNGCNTFELVLSELPDFPIVPLCIFQTNVNGSQAGWYKGILEFAPDVGTSKKEGFRFRGYGLRKQLDRVTAERVFNAPMDVGEIVATLVQENVVDETAIRYNPSKINTNTGVLIASNNDLSKTPIKKVFDMYATMAGCNWGVDGDGDFYFELRSTDVRRAIVVGYDCLEFEPELNVDEVKNSIFVKRQNGRGSGGVGWAVAAIANDATSQSKYGVRELQYQMAGYFSDDDCELVANALLDELSEPKYSAKIGGILVGDSTEPLERGVYNIIGPFQTYEAEINDCDDSADFTKFGAGDLALSTETAILMTGVGALKMSYTSAANDRAECSPNVKGSIQRIQFYVRSQNSGVVATVGVGAASWSENTRPIGINLANTWLLFDWDVSSLNLTEISKFAIRVDDTSSGIIYVDRIKAVLKGNRHYEMELREATYTFKGSERGVIETTFGPNPPKMYDYVSELMAQAQENKVVGENR